MMNVSGPLLPCYRYAIVISSHLHHTLITRLQRARSARDGHKALCYGGQDRVA
jgi:hypothetical protein